MDRRLPLPDEGGEVQRQGGLLHRHLPLRRPFHPSHQVPLLLHFLRFGQQDSFDIEIDKKNLVKKVPLILYLIYFSY